MESLVFGVMLVIVGVILLFQRKVPKFVSTLIFIGAGIAVISSTIAIIPAGHVGVPVLFGKVQDRSLPEGLHVINPLLNVVKMSVRTEVYTMSMMSGEGQKQGDDSITVLSKDGLRMPLDISIAYRLVADDAPSLYRNLGVNYIAKVIRPASRTAIREAASQFTAQEAYATKRGEVALQTQAGLERRIKAMLSEYEGIKGTGFIIQQVMLRNVSLPNRLRQAIEQKLAAEQEAQQMEFVLAKEKKEAERKAIEAKGIKEFQQIVSEGISDKLLRWKGIEATMEISKSPNAKVVIIGSGKDGLPIILNTDK